MKNFVIHLEKRRGLITILIFIQFISTISSLVLPYMNGRFLDLLIATINVDFLIKYALLIIGIGVLSIIVTYIYSVLNIKVKNNISFEINLDIINHLHKIELRKFENYNITYLTQRISDDSTTITGFFFDNILVVIMNILQVIILSIMLFKINISIYITMICFIPVYILIYIILKEPLFKSHMRYKERQNIFFDKLNNQFLLNREMKVHAIFSRAERKLRKEYKKFFESIQTLAKISCLYMSLDSMICLLFQATTLLIGGVQVIKGKISLGEFSILNIYFSSTINIIKYFFEFAKNFQEFKVSLRRMDELLDIPIEQNGNVVVNTLDSLEFVSNVEDILLKKGTFYAICGRNGTGKTTLLYYLTGILPCDVAKIKYNDFLLEHLNLYDLREKSISFMLQNEKTTTEKVKDFLFYNLEIYTIFDFNKQIWESDLKEFSICKEFNIFNLLDTAMNNISDGERQMVILIKTLVKKAEVYILDEPTSNLNQVFVERLAVYINKKKKNKIFIVVSHDNNILSQADKIISLN